MSRARGMAAAMSAPGISFHRGSMNKRFAAAVFLALAAASLHAAEEAPAAGLSPFAGNIGNAIWTLLIFVVVVVVLGKFAWGPVLALLQQREQFIHKSLSDAKHDREQAEASLKEYMAKLQSAQAEARSEERRVGKECRIRCRSRWSPYH